MGNLLTGLVGAAFIIVFLYGFFLSFSSGVPAYYEKRPGKKYSGCQLLIFRSLSAKLGTMGVVMATIALLFTATLISEGSGMLFNAMFESRSGQTTCYDLFIGSGSQDEGRFDGYLEYIDAHIPVREARQYRIYRGENLQLTEYVKANAGVYTDYDYDTLMRAGDYAALRAMLGYPAVTLEPGQYLIHCMSYLDGLLTGYDRPITVAGQTLKPGGVRSESFTQYLWDGNGRGFVLVVPDELAEARPVSHSIYAAMTQAPVPEADYHALRAIRDEQDTRGGWYDTIFSKAAVQAEQASSYAMIVFPLYYLALVLTMVSATILTIHQLSEAGRFRRQFGLLGKLGMEAREMKRVLRRQFAIYYTMPAVPPLLISLPFLAALGGAFDPGSLSSPGQRWAIVGATLGVFFFIYLIYILMAYTSLKRSALPAE